MFPRGETHSDEFFGEQEIYRRKFAGRDSVSAHARSRQPRPEARAAGLRGPAFCYLPQEWTARSRCRRRRSSAPGAHRHAATGDQLPVDHAFTMNARFDKPNELTVAWQIAPGYYLYRDKLTFEATGRIDARRADLPEGVAHRDDNFGDVEVFYDYVEIKVPFARASPDAIDVELTAGFQGCKERASAIRPVSRYGARAAGHERVPCGPLPAGSELVSEQDQWAAES